MGTNRKIKSDGSVEIESTATTVSGTLSSTGALSTSSTLDVTGATTLSDTLAVTGNTTVSSINNLTFPTADGTVDQVLKTDGLGTLSFATVSGGGGGGVDTIANASEASSYSGTNNIVLITSTADVEFTNDYEDKIFYCNTDISIKFSSDTLKNVTVLHSTQAGGKYLQLWNAVQGTTDSGANNQYTNCTFRAYRVHVKLGLRDNYVSFTSDDTFYEAYFRRCDIKCNFFDIEQSQLSNGNPPRSDFGFFAMSKVNFEQATTLNCFEFTHQKYTTDEGGQVTYLPDIRCIGASTVICSQARSKDGGSTMSTAPDNLCVFEASTGGKIIIHEGVGNSTTERLWLSIIKGDAYFTQKQIIISLNEAETKHSPNEVDLSPYQAIGSANFDTKINFDIVNNSVDKMWDSVNKRWLIPANQQYELQVYIVANNIPSNATVLIKHGVNGVVQSSTQFPRMENTGGGTRVLSCSRFFDFSAGQTIDLYINCSSLTTPPVQVVADSSFAILRPVRKIN